MDQSVEQLIIAQLEAIQGQMIDMRDFERDVLEAAVRARAGVDELRRELLGNGQPGRIQKLETAQEYALGKLGKHQSYIDKNTGAWAAVGRIAHYLLTAVLSFAVAVAVAAWGASK